MLATAGKTISIWDISTQEKVFETIPKIANICSLSFDSKGTSLFYGGLSSSLIVINLQTNEKRTKIISDFSSQLDQYT
jgi:WD40 repeat protein